MGVICLLSTLSNAITQVDLTARIREILRNYPEGTSIFKELIQNADDAGAKEVRLVIDGRSHGTSRLPRHGPLSQLQGPALLCFNDAKFTDVDFQSIQRLGDSLKKEDSKGTKTGRFGIGFNSVYHLTEVPMFVSGRYLVMFDPQATYLPNVNPANPGKLVDFPKHRQLVDSYPDQFLPFRVFGCDPLGLDPYESTLFRFPLRTAAQAETSRLSKQAHTVESIRAQLEAFAEEAPSMLLFLKNIERISVFEWAATSEDAAPRCFFQVRINNMTDDLRKRRNFVSAVLAAQGGQLPSRAVKCDYLLDIISGDLGATGSKAVVREDTWAVCNVLGGGRASVMAGQREHEHMKLIPWAGVAGRVACKTSSPSSSKGQEEEEGADATKVTATTGLAYCFLPLPVPTGLPVHVNGYFELSSNRRDIWYGDDMIGDGRMRAEWNRSLLCDLIGPSYVRLLTFVSPRIGPGPVYDSLWPLRANGPAWLELLAAFYQQAKVTPLLYTLLGGGTWVNPEVAVLIPPEGRDLTEGDGPSTLANILLEEALPLVRASVALEDVLIAKKVVSRVATPDFLRQHYRLPATPTKAPLTASHPSLRRRANVYLLLRYCLQDVNDTSPPTLLASLHMLPLLPTAGGGVRPLILYKITQGAPLDQLIGMGFPLGPCLKALSTHPPSSPQSGVEEATLSWLLESQAKAEKEGEAFELGDLVLASTDPEEELSLFTSVATHLLDVKDVHAAPKALLLSERLQRVSNVRTLTTAHLPAILRYLLPPTWREVPVVEWKDGTKGLPTLDWFKQLWRYLRGRMSEDLTPLQEQLPLLPCNEGYVCRLSSKLPCLNSGLAIPSPLLQCLRKVGVLTLHDSIVSDMGEVGMAGLGPYLHPPTRAGVLACLGILLQRAGKASPGTFASSLVSALSVEACQQLRSLIEREPIKELTADQLDTIRSLPIFLTAQPVAATPSVPPPLTSFASKPRYLLEVPIESWQDYEPLLTQEHVRPESQAQAELFRLLGAASLSKVDFLMWHMFPRYVTMDAAVRAKAMVELVLTDLPALVKADPKFAAMIRDLPFLPSAKGGEGGGPLSRCDAMYDPEVEELARLVGAEHFPHPDFATGEVLPVLRQLGLRMTLQFEDVVIIARSIKPVADKDMAAGLARAHNLFAFVNGNAERFFQPVPMGPDPKKKAMPKSFFDRALALFDEQGKAQERNRVAKLEEAERQRQDMVTQLRVTAWVPTLASPPLPFVPWRTADPSALALCPPTACRLQEDMWYSSASYGIVDADFVADAVKATFGWKSPLPAGVVAGQLVRIAEAFHIFSREHLPAPPPPTASATTNDPLQDGESTERTDPEVQKMRQTVTSVVPVFYQMLSNVSEAAKKEEIRKAFHGMPWVFVGDRFVHAEQVAFLSQMNATPYLYSVPPDLACFSPLLKAYGVRESFGCTDFVQVLQGMAVETNVKALQPPPVAVSTSKTTTAAPSRPPPAALPLSITQLELAIALVQRISDEVMQVSDWEIFAPDEHRVLARATDLVYDDAPWLSKAQNRKDIRFVHPKISAGVGDKLGIRSLRRLLMESHADLLDFGLPTEAFGQTESLTRRLRHILELYPEGPSILSELIQNADDAGASKVCIMYNARSYGTSSLMGQKMAAWQGPALYFYNNATFSREDFQNIARIGQASKLEKVVSTGRFGLGFNSTYHCTDLPSFISNDNLVMFDPHIKYLPGATKQQPGIKIRFVETDLLSQFPDQFEPYEFFDCDLRKPFPGTLFRFPLRTAELARESEISKSRYEADTIKELFGNFQESISRFLLFLRNVNKIEVWMHGAGAADKDPESQLLYQATRTLAAPAKWNEVSTFMTGPPQRPLSKEAFYAKLDSTPPAQLPRVKQALQVLYEEGTVNWEGTPLTSRRSRKDWFHVVTGLGGGTALAMAVAAQHRHLKFIPFGGVAAWLYTQPLVDGKEQGEPMVVVGDNAVAAKRGQVFCFLPLPVDSGLPVFVNGYFELSSNRRDIWSGGDMTGEGKRRSDWNQALLADVITPLYADLMAEIAKRLTFPEALTQYFSLFPLPHATQKHFAPVTTLFYQLARPMRLLYSETKSKGGGRWVPCQDALLINQDSSPITTRSSSDAASSESSAPTPAAGAATTSRLRDILLNRGLCVVSVPSELRKVLVDHQCCFDEASPRFVRQLVRQPHKGWPANQDDAQFLLVYCIRDLKDDQLQEVDGLPLIPLANGGLGTFAIGQGTTTDDPALPPSEHSRGAPQLYFIVEETEQPLFANAEHIRVTPPSTLLPRVSEFLLSGPVLQHTNVARFDPSNLQHFLSYVLPTSYSQSPETPWKPGEAAKGGIGVSPDVEWMQGLWAYLASPATFASKPSATPSTGPNSSTAAGAGGNSRGGPPSHTASAAAPILSLAHVSRACGRWTVLPAVVGKTQIRTLLRVDSGVSSIYIPESVRKANMDAESLQAALANLGIRVLDNRVLPSQAEPLLLSPESLDYARPLSTQTVLRTIHQIAGSDDESISEAFRNDVDADGRRALRTFLGDPGFLEQAKKDYSKDTFGLSVSLRQLPIYESYKGSSDPASRGPLDAFCSITRSAAHALPPTSVEDPHLLDTGSHVFIQSHHKNDTALLQSIGIQPMPLAVFYRDHFIERLSSLPALVRTKATLAMLSEIKTLKEMDGNFVKSLETKHFVPCGVVVLGGGDAGSRGAASSLSKEEDKVVLRRPCDLYDPMGPSLRALLDEDAFPHPDFCSLETTLNALRELGLQKCLDLDGVILSAKSVDDLLNRRLDRQRAASRGRELYRFLENHLEKLAQDLDAVALGPSGVSLPAPPSSGPVPPPTPPPSSHQQQPPATAAAPTPPPPPPPLVLPLQFLSDLRRLSWVPVRTVPPQPLMPFPPTDWPAVMPPSATRPRSDAWCCSGRLALSDMDSPKMSLMLDALGWSQPISPVVLAYQLLDLSVTFTRDSSTHLKNTLDRNVIPELYKSLQEQVVHPETGHLVKEWITVAKMLDRKAWVWVGDCFCDLSRVAFQAPKNSRPYLIEIPADLAKEYSPLFRALRVRETFHARDFVKALEVMCQEAGGAPVDVDRTVTLLNALHACPVEERRATLGRDNKDTVVYAPDKKGVMFRINELCYNDADWLMPQMQNRTNLRFVHDSLSCDVARVLGARSLRDALLSTQCSMASQPCPTATDVTKALSPYVQAAMLKHAGSPDADAEAMADLMVQAVLDVMEMAEFMHAPAVEVVLDERSHGIQSLLHPCLSEVQGPALVIYLPAVTLIPDDVIAFMSPNRELSMRAFPPIPGRSAVRSEGGGGKGDKDSGPTWPPQGRSLVSLFHITDCLQIMTGDQFHLFDPTGTYLVEDNSGGGGGGGAKSSGGQQEDAGDAQPGTGATQGGRRRRDSQDSTDSISSPSLHAGPWSGEAVSRRYKLEGQNLHTRFTDQFQPFMTLLPSLLASNTDVLINAKSSTGGGTGPFPIPGTIIRAPFRRSKDGALSSLCPTLSQSLSSRLAVLVESATPSLLFGLSLHRLRVGLWKQDKGNHSQSDSSGTPSQEGGEIENIFTISLVTSQVASVRQERKQVLESNSWKKANLWSTLTNKPGKPTQAVSKVEVRRESRGRPPSRETWLLLDSLAAGGTKDAALSEPFRSHATLPLISLVARLESGALREDDGDTARWVVAPGRFFCLQDTRVENGLPVHVNAPFLVCEALVPLFDSMKDKGQITMSNLGGFSGLRGPGCETLDRFCQWNRILLKALFGEVLPLLLDTLKDLTTEVRDCRGFYAYWPYLSPLPPRIKMLAHEGGLASRLQQGSYFLLQEKRGPQRHQPLRRLHSQQQREGESEMKSKRFVKLGEANFILQHCRAPLDSYLGTLFDLFDVPYKVAQELRGFNAPIKEVTPSRVRNKLREVNRDNSHGLRNAMEQERGLALELLCFCLSDAGVQQVRQGALRSCLRCWDSLAGLPLLPLEDGSCGRIADCGSVYLLAKPNERELLPHLKNRFISSEAMDRLGELWDNADFCTVTGVKRFSPQVLAANIHSILPESWKGTLRVSVSWDQVSAPFSCIWLYRFWQLVSVTEAAHLFGEWPLLPTTGNDLISCKHAPEVLRLSNVNKELQVKLEQEVALSSVSHTASHTLEQTPGDEAEGQEGSLGEEGGAAVDLVVSRSILLHVSDLFKLDELRGGKQQDREGELSSPSAQQQQQPQEVGGEGVGGQEATEVAEGDDTAQTPAAEDVGTAVEQQQPASSAAAAAVPADPTGRQLPAAEKEKRKALQQLFDVIQLPLLELAFFPPETHWELLMLDSREATCAAIFSLETFSQGIVWDRLSGADQDKLLRLLTTTSQGTPIRFSPSEVDKIKALPIFETLAGERVSIRDGGYVVLEETDARDRFTEELLRILMSSDLASRTKILKRKTEIGDLYVDLAIPSLSRASVLSKFLVPELRSMTRENRHQLLSFIRTRWGSESEDGLSKNEEFVRALKDAHFIEKADGQLVKASELYDPRNEVFLDFFDDDPFSFPPGEFAKPEWLVVLRALDLKCKVDSATLELCGQRMEQLSSMKTLPYPMAAKASRLIKQFVTWVAENGAQEKAFLKKFAALRCVPVEKPGLHINGDGSAGVTPHREYKLVSFSEACPFKERHIVWSVLPVLLPMHTPEQLSWSTLSILSPPSKDAVVKHLMNLTTAVTGQADGSSSDGSVQQGSILDSWVYVDPPVTVFQAIYNFLDENWAQIRAADKFALKELPCVPVGNRLVKASRLYFRLTQDLSPFMFEVPRAFGAYDKLFKDLGTRQSPSIRDYAQLLSELKGECGSNPLNPNELEAVIKVVVLLADTVSSQRNDGQVTPLSVRELLQSWELYVPDDRCVLVPMDTCLYDDASWLRGRVHAHLLRVVHPRINVQTCETYGIARISQVVRETLEQNFKPEVVPSADGGQLVDTFTSPEAARALACLLSHRGISVAGEEKEQQHEQQQQQQQGATDGVAGLDAKTRALQHRLRGFTVEQVRTLRSRFLRRRAVTGGQQSEGEEEEDITSQPEGSMFFVDEDRKVVLLASTLLPPSITPAYVLALAVTQMLAVGPEGESLVAPLSALLASPKARVPEVMELLRLDRRDEAQAEHLRRGVPGQPLLPMDRDRVELRPMRAHMKNEIVAWHGEDKVLKYGVVVGSPSDDREGYGARDGGSEERKSGGGGSHGRGGGGGQSAVVKVLLVRVAPRKVQEMATTQVYCFRATRSSGMSERDEGSQRITAAQSVPAVASGGGGGASRRVPSTVDSRLTSLLPMTTGGEGEGGATVVPPVPRTQLLDAVDDILARMGQSLDTDKREVMDRNIKLQEDLAAAHKQLDQSKTQYEALASELADIKKAFNCQICMQRDVDKILGPCGHMLCEECMKNVQARCPFCRERFTMIFPFFKPFST